MLKLLHELCRYIAVMNRDGLALLVNTARDITSRDKYRKADGDLTPEQFDRQVKQVLAIVERNHAKGGERNVVKGA